MILEQRLTVLEKKITRLEVMQGRIVPKHKSRAEKKIDVRKSILKIK